MKSVIMVRLRGEGCGKSQDPGSYIIGSALLRKGKKKPPECHKKSSEEGRIFN